MEEFRTYKEWEESTRLMIYEKQANKILEKTLGRTEANDWLESQGIPEQHWTLLKGVPMMGNGESLMLGEIDIRRIAATMQPETGERLLAEFERRKFAQLMAGSENKFFFSNRCWK